MPSRPRSAGSRRCSVVKTASLPITTPASFAPISAPQSHQGREIRIARVARTWATATQGAAQLGTGGMQRARPGRHSSSCASFGSRTTVLREQHPIVVDADHGVAHRGEFDAAPGRPRWPTVATRDSFGGPLVPSTPVPEERPVAPSPQAPATPSARHHQRSTHDLNPIGRLGRGVARHHRIVALGGRPRSSPPGGSTPPTTATSSISSAFPHRLAGRRQRPGRGPLLLRLANGATVTGGVLRRRRQDMHHRGASASAVTEAVTAIEKLPAVTSVSNPLSNDLTERLDQPAASLPASDADRGAAARGSIRQPTVPTAAWPTPP